MLAVIRHSVEQIGIPDAGSVLAIARPGQQPPVIIDRRCKESQRGIRAAGAHHGHIRLGVVPLIVQRQYRHGRSRAVDRDHIGAAIFGTVFQPLALVKFIGSQLFHQGFAALIPKRWVHHLRGILGAVCGRRCGGIGNALFFLGHGGLFLLAVAIRGAVCTVGRGGAGISLALVGLVGNGAIGFYQQKAACTHQNKHGNAENQGDQGMHAAVLFA